jgi:hypothetical protein
MISVRRALDAGQPTFSSERLEMKTLSDEAVILVAKELSQATGIEEHLVNRHARRSVTRPLVHHAGRTEQSYRQRP